MLMCAWIAEVEDDVSRYELELGSKHQSMADIKALYKDIMSWADIFMDSDKEVKKMIAAYLIESVKVSRGYEVEVKFHVAYEQFCEINNLSGDAMPDRAS